MMKSVRTFATSVIALSFFAAPAMSSAAALTSQQATSLIAVVQSSPGTPASAFVSLITAFSNITVPQAISLIAVVQSAPGTPASAFVSLLTSFTVDTAAPQPTAPANDPPATPTYALPTDSVYPTGTPGFDISFSTVSYPSTPFGFAVIGATGGKAFTHNARMASQFNWARSSSVVAPTIYLNVNAPYGSSATMANVSSPKECDAHFGATATSALSGGTFPEPTVCAGYNYGYNTAKDAYAYASKLWYFPVRFWWLDVEEANSWSDDTAVNGAVMQGAIDYLNTEGVRAGIYSVPYMWKLIAGSSFTPTQTIQGKTVSIPSWYAIGIANRVDAINACKTKGGFFAGSPIWVIQYVENATAVDQNVAC